MSQLVKVDGFLFWGAIAWLLVAGLLAFQFWPHLPESSSGWVLFIAFGPPLYILAEGASEYFWRSKAGRSLSEPSHNMQRVFIVASVVIGGMFAWGLWWLSSH
jgi:hypothetical protein